MRRHYSDFVLWHFLLISLMVVSGCASFGPNPLKEGITAYEAEDYDTAMGLWKPLAEQGNADAQFNIGVMYDNGQGVEKILSKPSYGTAGQLTRDTSRLFSISEKLTGSVKELIGRIYARPLNGIKRRQILDTQKHSMPLVCSFLLDRAFPRMSAPGWNGYARPQRPGILRHSS